MTWAVCDSATSEWGTIGGGGNWSSNVAWGNGGCVSSTWGVESGGTSNVAGGGDWGTDWSSVGSGVGSTWGEGAVGSAVSWVVRGISVAHCKDVL